MAHDAIAALEELALRDWLAKHRAAHPSETGKLILCIDRRKDSPIARFVIAVPASSPWHDLLPDEQIAEICDRGSSRRI